MCADWVKPIVSPPGLRHADSSPGEVYVSLTSIFANQRRVACVLRSLVEQTRPPDRIFLHLSEEPYLKDAGFPGRNLTEDELVSTLDRYRDRVEVRWVPNRGPYRKLLPLLAELYGREEHFAVLTVDDDTEYHPGVVEALLGDGAPVRCLRGFAIAAECPGDLGRWGYFRRRRISQGTALMSFSTGVGGVLYRREAFEAVKDILLDESIYLDCCPTNDDIWFNFLRIANGVPMTVVDAPYVTLDRTNRETSLWKNFNGAGNNQQIRSTAKRLVEMGLLRSDASRLRAGGSTD